MNRIKKANISKISCCWLLLVKYYKYQTEYCEKKNNNKLVLLLL